MKPERTSKGFANQLVGSPTGVFAVVETNSDGKHYLHYILKDHLGSWTATLHGNTVERLSYDAWGRHRNAIGFGPHATQI